jgi:hypothetical protein
MKFLCLDLNIFDITKNYRKFWIKAMKEIIVIEKELMDETPKWGKIIKDEGIHFSKYASMEDEGEMFRWFYIITKK